MAGVMKPTRKQNPETSLKQRNIELEAAVKTLKKKLKMAKTKNQQKTPSTGIFKRIVIIILVFITALFLNLGVGAVWLKRNVVNTDIWVGKTTEFIENPDIRAKISTGIANQIFEQADIEKYVVQILPPEINSLATPLTNNLESYTQQKIDTAMQSEAFLNFWTKANQAAHQGIVDSLENGGKATDEMKQNNVVYINDDKLLLNLKPVFLNIKSKLSEQGLGFVDKLSGDRINGTVTLTEIKNMQSALLVFDAINKIALLLPIFAIAAGAGALALSASKRKTLMAIGILTAVFMVANVQLIYLAKYPLVNSIAQGLSSASTASAEATFTLLTKDLVLMSRTLLAVSLVLVLGCILAGPSKFAKKSREIYGQLITAGDKNSPTNSWIAKNAYTIVTLISTLALVLLLFPLGSGPGYVLTVVILALIVAFSALSIKQSKEE